MGTKEQVLCIQATQNPYIRALKNCIETTITQCSFVTGGIPCHSYRNVQTKRLPMDRLSTNYPPLLIFAILHSKELSEQQNVIKKRSTDSAYIKNPKLSVSQ